MSARRQTPRRVYFEEANAPEAVASVAPRSAITTEEDLEEEAPRKQGLFARVKQARQKAAKEKASKSFERQYGGEETATAKEGAPRAALYKGEMGSGQRRATRMQASGQKGASYASRMKAATSPKEMAHPVRTRILIILGALFLALLIAVVFLFEPAKLFYQEMRENQRLQIEYEALQERNDAIQEEVDSLNSEEGIEDRAHQEFGWVKDGEKAVSVSGVTPSEPDYNPNIAPGSIRPPDTWYSPILDPLFGVE